MPKPSKQPQPPPDHHKGRPQKRGRRGGKRRNPAGPQAAPPSLPSTRVVRANALGASLPELIITYTNERRVIAEWLQQHVSPSVHCLGLDTETKPSFTREAAKAKKGPDVLQLAKSDGHCLVIHLSQMEMEDPPTTTTTAASALFDILNSRDIAKAGVSIDDDALALHENKQLDVHCRLELRNIDKQEQDNTTSSNGSEEDTNTEENNTHNNTTKVPQNLQGLSQHYVPNLKLPKHKKLQMSNWELPLSDAQIEYAAGDAFAAAYSI
jgi:3'-5' exonuclease